MAAENPFLVWELAGIVFIVVLGMVLHFAFEWSGRWTPIAPIAVVNESVWERLMSPLLRKLNHFPPNKRVALGELYPKFLGFYTRFCY